jgi:hypothetical protein
MGEPRGHPSSHRLLPAIRESPVPLCRGVRVYLDGHVVKLALTAGTLPKASSSISKALMEVIHGFRQQTALNRPRPGH